MSMLFSSIGGDEINPECLMVFFPCSKFWTGNLLLVAIYGYILSRAAKTIADGSELLLDVLHPGVIGGLVIPLLGLSERSFKNELGKWKSCLNEKLTFRKKKLTKTGALPDATIIFVSVAVGKIGQVREEIHVGMGTLTGSTIMLLTVAWVAGLIAGRCDIVGGRSIDRRLTRKPWDLQIGRAQV